MPLQESVKTTESQCRLCGYKFDAASGMTGAQKPYPGSVSICMRCGAIGVFEEDLSVRPATENEVREIMSSNVGPVITKMQATLRSPAMQGTFPSESKKDLTTTQGKHD